MDSKAQTAAARAVRWQNHEPTERVTVRLPVSLMDRARVRPGRLTDVVLEALRSHLDALDELDQKDSSR